MMTYLRASLIIILALCAIYHLCLGMEEMESDAFVSKEAEDLIPAILRRKYFEWSREPKKRDHTIRSIEFQVEEIGTMQYSMAVPFPKKKLSLIKAELWMEFYENDLQTRPGANDYFVEVIPREVPYDYRLHTSQRPIMRENRLELPFNITRLFMKVRKVYEKELKFDLHLHAASKVKSESLGSRMRAFLLLYEKYYDDGSDYAFFMSKLREVQQLRRKHKQPALYTGNFRSGQFQSRSLISHAYLDDRKRRRRGNLKICTLKKWNVDFSAVGWGNWLIAPAYHTVNQCAGKCVFPLSQKMNATNHAIVQTMANSILGKPRAAACAPNSLSGLTVIAAKSDDSSNYEMKSLDNMVVNSCGCI